MFKYIISIIYLALCISQMSFAQIDLNKFLAPESDDFNDIGYLHIVPQYEEVMDPKKAVAIEIYFGEYDGTAESKAKLNYIKNILQDDKRIYGARSEIIAMGENPDEIIHSQAFAKFKDYTGTNESKVYKDKIPQYLSQQIVKKSDKSKRYPASLNNGRTFWSFIRFSSSTAGVFAGLYFMEGLSAPIAASVALVPGLASGGITYYSNAYGAFLTNGKWAKWLLESDNFFAKNMRSAFKLNAKTFEDSLLKNKIHFRDKYPTLYQKNPDLFDKNIVQQTTQNMKQGRGKFTKLLSRMKTAEEYFKWWVTEVAFVGIAVKIPQSIAGIGTASSLTGAVSDVLVGSTMGMLAQGPGDIAIQKRKYQKVEELKESVLSGKTKADNKKALLDEIEKVLDTNGKYKNYTITESSHKLLVKIENWSRSRSTILSFLSVTGVGLEIAGVPAARPLLIGVGLWGAGYYASVQGWISPKKIKASFANLVENIRSGEFKFSMSFLKTRYCGAPFKMKVTP